MLNVKSLREQVYQYLRDEIHDGKLLPGSIINLSEISGQLGISKTPLRDALIQLESEGFVEIMPRRGVVVKTVSFQDIKDAYQIIGALEGSVVASVFNKIRPAQITKMRRLNAAMRKAILQGEFAEYFEMNIGFHNIFLDLSDNRSLRQIVMPLKQRLYEFPRRGYIKEWELSNCDEHQEFIKKIEEGKCEEAVRVMRDVHWSFSVQEKYIKEFYSPLGHRATAGVLKPHKGGGLKPEAA